MTGGWVGGVSDGGQEGHTPLHAGDGSFQVVSISIMNPRGCDIIGVFDGCGSGLVMVSTVFHSASGKGGC